MEYSTLERGQEISATGVVYEIGSVYERLGYLTDVRKARGKQYSLVTIMMLILLANLLKLRIGRKTIKPSWLNC